MILLPWEKNFEYKFSKMLFDVFGDLSLLWHLPNQDIACKQFKIVKIPKKCLFIVLCSYNNILSRSKCAYETFVLICHHCGTGLIRILCPKRSKQSKYQKKNACSLCFVLTIYTLKVQMCYETFVLICHHGGTGGTGLIRILCPKESKK